MFLRKDACAPAGIPVVNFPSGFADQTLKPILLRSPRREVDGQATLLGFVGTPWTLAAYAMEGKADRDCKQTKVWGRGGRGQGGCWVIEYCPGHGCW